VFEVVVQNKLIPIVDVSTLQHQRHTFKNMHKFNRQQVTSFKHISILSPYDSDVTYNLHNDWIHWSC